jgi:hypothetical protein
MTPLESVQIQAERLSTEDVGKLRRWLAAFEAALWHRELEADLHAAWLGTLAVGATDNSDAGRGTCP